ncbi:MAG: hypothetical protein JRN68_04640 [Nitrososphaerota archaeon]|nr:hypothetical protein [Nitrososphaerota archaeon]
MVQRMNVLLEAGDISGFKVLVSQNRKEVTVAANYVNAKYRYLAQWIVSATLNERQEKERQDPADF